MLAGGDALVLMPTGGGKSLCYQVPALCRPGTAIVVSPLIALMDDQVAALRQLGVSAGALHSEVEPDEAPETARRWTPARLDLLYVSPERLLMSGTLERLRRRRDRADRDRRGALRVAWGHEFRPEYRGLARLAERVPRGAAHRADGDRGSAHPADILQALDMPDAEVFAASFHRANLHIAAQAKEGETAELLAFLARAPGRPASSTAAAATRPSGSRSG